MNYSNSKKDNKPILFSEHFGVDKDRMKELGVFNPILNFDTRLFVDTMLLKSSSSEIIRKAFDNYNEYFAKLFRLLKASKEKNDKCYRQAKQMSKFPEYKYTCIGYASSSIDGSGSGLELSDKIFQSAIEIIEFAKSDPEIFLLLPLLEEGIGADRISDMTQQIIDDDICQYTVNIMQKLNLKGNYSYKSNKHKFYSLLKNPYSNCPIKLLPQDILSNLPTADRIDEVILDMVETNQDLRGSINANIQHIFYQTSKETKSTKKETLLKEIKENKEFFLEILKTLKEYSFEHYDLEKDAVGIYRWLEDSKKFIEEKIVNREKAIVNDDLESISKVVKSIIMDFKKLIENKDLWRIFWTKVNGKFRHVKEFYSQMLFYMVSNLSLTSQNSNVKVARIPNKETKQLELIYSISGKHKVVVCIKNADNYQGLEKCYNANTKFIKNISNIKGFYVVMDFKDKTSKQLENIRKSTNSCFEIIEIDVARQEKKKESEFDFDLEDWDLEIPELDLKDWTMELDGVDDNLYINEKKKAGANSYQKYKPLKDKVKEICLNELNNKKFTSALQLCEMVSKLIEKDYKNLLNNFAPYQKYKKDNTDWTKPTFYNWCNAVYKSL